VVGDRALALGRARDAGLQVVRDGVKRLVSAGEVDAAPRVDERLLGGQQYLGGAVDIGG